MDATTMTTPTEALEAQLRELIEADRAAFVAYFAGRIRRGLERFLEDREGKKLAYEVYPDHQEPTGLREATDYRQAEAAYFEATHGIRVKLDARQPWAVTFRPDADAAILKIAEQQAEDQIRTFLTRALEKLGPVVEGDPQYDATRKGQGRLNGAAWVGEMAFHFVGMKFVARLKVILNWSAKGNPYHQYPMTFHNFTFDAGYGTPVRSEASISIEEIWAAVGYTPPPTPPAMARRWKKLVTGAVVLVAGKPTLVESPSAAKKSGIPEDAEQVARIESVNVSKNPYKGNPRISGRIEWAADGKGKHIELEGEDAAQALQLDKDGKFNQATAEARRAIFAQVFGTKGGEA